MSPALKDMLNAYQPVTPADYQNAAREIVQEIALLGLWRGGFFEHAAFYGGTALRIFHGLRRFSEDLDFTLLASGDVTRMKSRIKGRDFYDLVWYVGRNISPNLEHLDARMRQSGHWDGGPLTKEILVGLLRERFSKIDFKQAADEVRVFLSDPRELELWSRGFFDDLAGRLAAG